MAIAVSDIVMRAGGEDVYSNSYQSSLSAKSRRIRKR